MAFRGSIQNVIDVVRQGPFDGDPTDEVKHTTSAMMQLLTDSR